MKKLLMIICTAISCMTFAQEALTSVTITKVQQRYPWNGKVDIDFEIKDDNVNRQFLVDLTAKDKSKEPAEVLKTESFSFDTAKITEKTEDGKLKFIVNPGVNRLTWDAEADLVDSVKKVFSNVTFLISAKPVLISEPNPQLYMVVDLSGGTSATSYPVTYLADVPTGGWTDEHKASKIVFRQIPAGTFTMGSPDGEGYSAEKPQHEVTLSKPFYMGVFEVTQKQYELVMGNKPSNFTGDTLPVEQVSWDTIKNETSGFMTVLSGKVADLNFDLPTEAQWEYACRAGTTTAYNVTGKELSDLGWFSDNSDSKTHTVGGKLPNAWGLYDMHGNVWEWCLDWFENYSDGAVTDPTGPGSGYLRVIRGGCCYDGTGGCRSAYRSYDDSSYAGDDIGFRPVAVVQQ